MIEKYKNVYKHKPELEILELNETLIQWNMSSFKHYPLPLVYDGCHDRWHICWYQIWETSVCPARQQCIFADDNSFCGGIWSKKDRKQQGEKRRHQRHEGDDEWTRNVYSVWQKYLLTVLLHYLRIVVHYNRHILWKLKLSCPTFLGRHYKTKTANNTYKISIVALLECLIC